MQNLTATMRALRADFKNFTADIRNASVEMNANLQSQQITTNHSTYDITENHPTLCFCDLRSLKIYHRER